MYHEKDLAFAPNGTFEMKKVHLKIENGSVSNQNIIELLEHIDKLVQDILTESCDDSTIRVHGVPLCKEDLSTLLLFNALLGKKEGILECLRLGAEPKHRFFKRWSVLHWCASLRKIFSMHTLINTTNVNFLSIRDKNDMSPFDILYQEISLCKEESRLSKIRHRIVSWGDGGNYVLGHGDANTREDPKRIVGIDTKRIISITGSRYTSASIDENGDLYMWGLGDSFRIGIATTIEIVPKKIESQLFGQRKALQVALSDYHGGLVMNDGALFTFGSNKYGQLGFESQKEDDFFSPFVKVNISLSSPGIVQKLKVAKVTCSNVHTIACTTTGQCFTFGYGLDGQLGHGLLKNEHRPRFVTSLGNKDIIDISAGKTHSLFSTSQQEVFVSGFGDPLPKKLFLTGGQRIFGNLCHASGDDHYIVADVHNSVYMYVHKLDQNHFKPCKLENYKCGPIRNVYCWQDNSYILTGDGLIYQFNIRRQKEMSLLTASHRFLDFVPSKSHYLGIEESVLSDDRTLEEESIYFPLLCVLEDETYHDTCVTLKDGSITLLELMLWRIPSLRNTIPSAEKHDNKITIHLPQYNLDQFKTLLHGICTDRWVPMGKSQGFLKAYVNMLLDLKMHDVALSVNPKLYLKNIDTIEPLDTFLKELINSKNGDYTLILKKTNNEVLEKFSVKVHKAILCAQSDWFLMVFSNPYWKENLENEAEISDIEYDTMMNVLNFLYVGTLPSLGFIEIVNVLEASDLLLIPKLKDLSCKRMLNMMTPDNIATIFAIAETYHLSDVLEAATSFTINNLELLMRLNALAYVDDSILKTIETKISIIKQEGYSNFGREEFLRLEKVLTNWNTKFNTREQVKAGNKKSSNQTSNKDSTLTPLKGKVPDVLGPKLVVPNPKISSTSDSIELSPKKQELYTKKVTIPHNSWNSSPPSRSPEKSITSTSNDNVIWDSMRRKMHAKNAKSSHWSSEKPTTVSLASIQQEQLQESKKKVLTIQEIIEEEEMLKEHKLVEEFYERKKLEAQRTENQHKQRRRRGHRENRVRGK